MAMRTGVDRSWKRGLLFRLAPLLALAVSVLLLESALRIAGYGHSGEYLRLRDIGGKPHWVEDRNYFRAFFPPNLLPSVEPLAVPADRGGAVRVVVLGESAALGTPEPAFGFSRILDRMLSHRHPDLAFEVVNVSATAINTHVLADLAPRLRALQPDLFVVYAGHNEVVGPFGPGTVFAPFLADLRLVKAAIFLGRTRTGQLVRDAWRRLAWMAHPPERWAGLRMFKERAIAPGAPCLRPVYRHFRRNLESIIASARSMGAGVILCTLGSRLRGFAPLASLEPQDGSDEAAAESGRALDHYLRARTLLSEGRAREAAGEFSLARDLDALRLRADSRLNASIRETAALSSGDGARLADAEAAFAAASPAGIPGRELFYEHVHPTFAGNHALARAVLAQADSLLLSRGLIAAIPADEPLDEEACRRSLALTGWDRLGMAERIATLLDRPPFAGRPGSEEEAAPLASERDSLAHYARDVGAAEVTEEYRQAVETYPADPILRKSFGAWLQALGQAGDAARQLEAALRFHPHDARARQLLALALVDQGLLVAAAAQYRQALADDPWLPELRNGLGNLLARQGDARGAIGQYRLALQSHPHLPEIHYNLGRAYADAERPAEAEAAYRKALNLDPGFKLAAQALGVR